MSETWGTFSDLDKIERHLQQVTADINRMAREKEAFKKLIDDMLECIDNPDKRNEFEKRYVEIMLRSCT